MLEHTNRLRTRMQNYLIKFVTFYMHILRYVKLSNFILFSRENDDMESWKRFVKLLSLIFIIRCINFQF